jgi:hypothetical protein
LNHPGWQQVEKILNFNIEIVRKQLEDGIEGETKEDIELRRAKLKFQQTLLDLPSKMISDFTSTDSIKPSNDPYFTPNEIKEERKFDNKA